MTLMKGWGDSINDHNNNCDKDYDKYYCTISSTIENMLSQ